MEATSYVAGPITVGHSAADLISSNLDGHPNQDELYPYIEWKIARHDVE